MKKILISDKLSQQAVDIFKNNGMEVDVKTGLAEEELLKIIGEYDGLAIRSSTKVTRKLLEAAKNLKVVGRAGIGVDNVDLAAATDHGVVVMNTPFGNSITTAEHAIAMMFALAREIPAASSSTHAGKWEKNRFMGVELTGKVLGLIGCGNIGSIVADRAQGLKMRVIAYDPYLSEERAREMNFEKVELEELFKRADFITLHTPLTDATRNIINKESFAKMKKGVRIINCARGGLINEADLKDAIESDHVAGAALDVFEVEPAKDNLLFGMEQIVATPHLGASTNEAQEKVALQVAEQMSDFLNNGTITNAVNMASVSAEDAVKLRPFLNLATQLGSFAGQLTESGIKSILIEYEGGVAEFNTKPITAIMLQSVLSTQTENVNMVNALSIAKQRNIEVSEIKHERKGDYRSMVRIAIKSDRENIEVAGALFSNRPRIIEVNGIKLEAGLSDRVIFVVNDDKPGFIGKLGQVIGDAGVNIANFNLGRNDNKSEAIALVEIDQNADDTLIATISALPNVKRVKMMNF